MAVRKGFGGGATGQADGSLALSMHVDAEDFRRVLLGAKDFDKKLYARLRKEMREAGAEIVGDVQKTIGEIPSRRGRHTGLRAALQKGTRVAISTGGKTGRNAGIRITTAARGRPVKAFNAKEVRHLVFGRPRTWTGQDSRPYFGAVISKHYEGVRARVIHALDDAAAEMARKVED